MGADWQRGIKGLHRTLNGRCNWFTVCITGALRQTTRRKALLCGKRYRLLSVLVRFQKRTGCPRPQGPTILWQTPNMRTANSEGPTDRIKGASAIDDHCCQHPLTAEHIIREARLTIYRSLLRHFNLTC
jgi:hypothetical protein